MDATASERSWQEAVEFCWNPPVAVVGVGNRLRGDDAVGPAIVDRLCGHCPFPCFDGGTAPENLAAPLCRCGPRTILLVDAVHFGVDPGGIRLFASRKLAEVDVSTHAASPGLLIEYLQERTGAEVYLLGVQPLRCAFGEAMSGPCRAAVSEVAQLLANTGVRSRG